MKIVLKTINLDLTPSLEKYIDIKLKPLEKLIKHLDPDGVAELDIELARTTKHHLKGLVFAAEAHVRIPKKIFRASERGQDIRSAIDATKDSLHLMIQKYKDLQIAKEHGR